VPVPLSTYEHDGYRFDVRDVGPENGPVIIALHGFPQTSACWDPMLPSLTSAGYRVLAPDQRGYSPGARPQEMAAYRMDRLAGDVLALADAAGAETFHLLGHDWGAGVGWHLAAWQPARLRSLSVVSTPHPRAMRRAFLGTQALRSWYVLFFQLPRVPELLLRAGRGSTLRRLLTSTGCPDPDVAVELMLQPDATTATVNWYRALRVRGVPRVGRVAVPTLYVWSDGDTALDRRAAANTARWVSADYHFEILTGVSHWIPGERPLELAELVLGHVARHP